MCNHATPPAHEPHTDVFDNLKTREGAGIAGGQKPDTARGGMKRRDARRQDWAPRAKKGRTNTENSRSGTDRHQD